MTPLELQPPTSKNAQGMLECRRCIRIAAKGARAPFEEISVTGGWYDAKLAYDIGCIIISRGQFASRRDIEKKRNSAARVSRTRVRALLLQRYNVFRVQFRERDATARRGRNYRIFSWVVS